MGIIYLLNRASWYSLGDSISTSLIVAGSIILGPLAGVLLVFIVAVLIKWTGSWIGGKASLKEIRAAYVWGSIPYMVSGLLWIPYLLIAGKEMFTYEMPIVESSDVKILLLFLLFIIEAVIMIWSIVLIILTMTEVQKFKSAWKGLLNMFLAVLIPLAVLFFVGFFYYFIAYILEIGG